MEFRRSKRRQTNAGIGGITISLRLYEMFTFVSLKFTFTPLKFTFTLLKFTFTLLKFTFTLLNLSIYHA